MLVVGGGIVGCTLACRLAQDIAATSTTVGGVNPRGDLKCAAAATTPTTTSAGGDDDRNNENQNRRQRQRQRGPSVGLIELRPPTSLRAALARASPDPRVYSLAPASVKVLRDVGVWDGVRRGGGSGGSDGGGEGGEGVAAVLKERSQAFGGMQVCGCLFVCMCVRVCVSCVSVWV